MRRGQGDLAPVFGSGGSPPVWLAVWHGHVLLLFRCTYSSLVNFLVEVYKLKYVSRIIHMLDFRQAWWFWGNCLHARLAWSPKTVKECRKNCFLSSSKNKRIVTISQRYKIFLLRYWDSAYPSTWFLVRRLTHNLRSKWLFKNNVKTSL